jgi:hypothetical protein
VIVIAALSLRHGARSEPVKRALARLVEIDPGLTVITLVREADRRHGRFCGRMGSRAPGKAAPVPRG